MSDKIEKMRAEFRAWFETTIRPNCGLVVTFRLHEDGSYLYAHTQQAWMTWQRRQPEIDALQARIADLERQVADGSVVVLTEYLTQACDALRELAGPYIGTTKQHKLRDDLRRQCERNVQAAAMRYTYEAALNATTITAAELEALRRDAGLLPLVIEAALEAAEDWSKYVEEDTAPRVCSEHVKKAIDAVMAAQDAPAGGE